jgi:hypothetical protein
VEGSIAQLVEQRIENPRVAGSIPARATTFLPLMINFPTCWKIPSADDMAFPHRHSAFKEIPKNHRPAACIRYQP